MQLSSIYTCKHIKLSTARVYTFSIIFTGEAYRVCQTTGQYIWNTESSNSTRQLGSSEDCYVWGFLICFDWMEISIPIFDDLLEFFISLILRGDREFSSSTAMLVA